MFNGKNIIDEINNDLQKEYNGDLFKCRLVLFQFFQLKQLSRFKPDYIGYTLLKSVKNSKAQYALDIPEVGALSNAKIFTEVKNVAIDDYYFELLKQFDSELSLKEKFTSILNSLNISYNKESSLYELFQCLKNNNEDIFRQREHFAFRFFKLSDKYAPYESTLLEALKEEHGWRQNFKLVRGI